MERQEKLTQYAMKYAAASVSISAAFVAFMVWAYVPETILQAIGLTYYPAKDWAVGLPAWVLMACVATICIYEGLNIMGIPFLESLDQATMMPPGMHTNRQAQRPCCDLSLAAINRHLYQHKKHRGVLNKCVVVVPNESKSFIVKSLSCGGSFK
eukprot:jgi/Botrbrau1/16844/Bobra.150_2s0066.1